jgi:predicted secreted protein
MTCTSLTVLADTPVYHRVDFSTEVARETVNDQLNATLSIELSDKDAGRLAQQLTLATNDALKKAAAFPQVKTSSGNQHTWPIYGSTPHFQQQVGKLARPALKSASKHATLKRPVN